jgi:hypothetical protein
MAFCFPVLAAPCFRPLTSVLVVWPVESGRLTGGHVGDDGPGASVHQAPGAAPGLLGTHRHVACEPQQTRCQTTSTFLTSSLLLMVSLEGVSRCVCGGVMSTWCGSVQRLLRCTAVPCSSARTNLLLGGHQSAMFERSPLAPVSPLLVHVLRGHHCAGVPPCSRTGGVAPRRTFVTSCTAVWPRTSSTAWCGAPAPSTTRSAAAWRTSCRTRTWCRS